MPYNFGSIKYNSSHGKWKNKSEKNPPRTMSIECIMAFEVVCNWVCLITLDDNRLFSSQMHFFHFENSLKRFDSMKNPWLAVETVLKLKIYLSDYSHRLDFRLDFKKIIRIEICIHCTNVVSFSASFDVYLNVMRIYNIFFLSRWRTQKPSSLRNYA